MKVLTPDEVSAIVGVSTASLERYRNEGIGPNFLRIGPGGLIKYLESDVHEWLTSCRQLPPIDGSKAATPAAIAAAMQTGSAERRAAMQARQQDMQDLDAADLGEPDPYALTMGVANQPAGAKIERHFNVPPRSFDNSPQVAIANAQNGKVPVPPPWKKD